MSSGSRDLTDFHHDKRTRPKAKRALCAPTTRPLRALTARSLVLSAVLAAALAGWRVRQRPACLCNPCASDEVPVWQRYRQPRSLTTDRRCWPYAYCS